MTGEKPATILGQRFSQSEPLTKPGRVVAGFSKVATTLGGENHHEWWVVDLPFLKHVSWDHSSQHLVSTLW